VDFNFFFGFAGRINRAKCWRVMLLNAVVVMMFLLIVPLSLGDSWGFAEIFCLRGTKGPNRFGSDPLAKGNMSFHAIQHRHA
jgi:uncharacterized membrane protein YhaH (DUF805 family)